MVWMWMWTRRWWGRGEVAREGTTPPQSKGEANAVDDITALCSSLPPHKQANTLVFHLLSSEPTPSGGAGLLLLHIPRSAEIFEA